MQVKHSMQKDVPHAFTADLESRMYVEAQS
jgi:hypothetical protein